MKTCDLNKYRLIEPGSAIRFLADHGWIELNIKPEIVAMWGIEKNGKTHKVLLPLNPDFPDYPNRMIAALETVGEVESMGETDLLESLLDKSIVATERNRELMDLRLLPDPSSGGVNEFPAKALGFILSSLQNLVDSIGQAEEGLFSAAAGIVPTAITDRTKLSVIGTAPGSFVVKLAGELPPVQVNLLDQLNGSLEQRALSSFLSLIKISHEGRLEDLRILLVRLQRRTLVTYKKFLGSMSSANAGLDIKLGSSNPDVGGRVRLNSTEILGLIAFLSQIEPQTPEIIRVDGTLKLIGGKNKKLTFGMKRLNNDDFFYGGIAPSVIEKDIELTHNRNYRATIEETLSIDPITNESTKKWKLIDIDYL